MKLPFIQFYPADYQNDTRMLSLAAKGGWVDILCMLHSSSTRGEMTLPMLGWARIMGAGVDQASAVIAELECMKIAEITRDGNGLVTVTNRRMSRDAITRQQTRLRVERHRSKEAGNAPGNAPVTGQKTEGRRQKTEDRIDPKPEGAASAHADLADDAGGKVLLTFPCNGKQPTWDLREDFLKRLTGLYAPLDVLAEARLALGKIEAGAVTKKTARGMTKFLFSWMDRSTNKMRAPAGQSARPRTDPRIAPWAQD
jgi:uncharacterized protein YdaU (DUF1376 family)